MFFCKIAKNIDIQNIVCIFATDGANGRKAPSPTSLVGCASVGAPNLLFIPMVEGVAGSAFATL